MHCYATSPLISMNRTSLIQTLDEFLQYSQVLLRDAGNLPPKNCLN